MFVKNNRKLVSKYNTVDNNKPPNIIFKANYLNSITFIKK